MFQSIISSSKTKKNKLLSMMVFIFLTFVTQVSFAVNRQDIHKKLDDLVLHENVFNRLKINTFGEITTTFRDSTRGDMVEKIEIKAVWKRTGWTDLVWGIGTFTNLDSDSSTFDFTAGTFTKTYHYQNKLRQVIPISFTLKADLIKSLEPTEEVRIVEHLATEALAVVSHEDEHEDETGSLAAASKDGDGESFERFEGAIRKLEFLSDFSHSILKACGQADHIYTAAVVGVEGTCNFFEGVISLNLFTALKGATQIAVAGMSGKRVYDGYKEDAEQLLSEIQDSASQINDLSQTTEELIKTVSKSLEGVQTRLSLVKIEHDRARELFKSASGDQSDKMRLVLEKYEEAVAQGKLAGSAFEEFQKTTTGIVKRWQEIGKDLATLEGDFVNKIEQSENMLNCLQDMEGLVKKMRANLNAVSGEFHKQTELSDVVNGHRDTQDRLVSEANLQLLEIIRTSAVANAKMELALSETQAKISESELQIKSQQEELARGQQQMRKTAELSAKIKRDAEKVEEKVRSMYTTSELVVLGSVTLFCPGGPLLKSGAAFLALKAFKGWSRAEPKVKTIPK